METNAEIKYSGDIDLIMMRNSRLERKSRPLLTKIHREDLFLQAHNALRQTSFKIENLQINIYLSCPIKMKYNIHILPFTYEFLY